MDIYTTKVNNYLIDLFQRKLHLKIVKKIQTFDILLLIFLYTFNNFYLMHPRIILYFISSQKLPIFCGMNSVYLKLLNFPTPAPPKFTTLLSFCPKLNVIYYILHLLSLNSLPLKVFFLFFQFSIPQKSLLLAFDYPKIASNILSIMYFIYYFILTPHSWTRLLIYVLNPQFFYLCPLQYLSLNYRSFSIDQ